MFFFLKKKNPCSVSLQLVVYFCSVILRIVHAHFPMTQESHSYVAQIPRMCRPYENKIIFMSHMCAFAHFTLDLTLHLCTLTSSSSIFSSRTTSQFHLTINKHCAAPSKEESDPLAQTTSSTDYESYVFGNFDHSETTEIFLQAQSSDTISSHLHDAEPVTRPSTERSLYHCSFKSEKNQQTVDKLITLSKKV